jgi:RNA-directed DNA polymerase
MSARRPLERAPRPGPPPRTARASSHENLASPPRDGRRTCKRGRGRLGRPVIHTYPSKRALASVKATVKAITRSGYHHTLDQLLYRLNPVLRGWCAYFRHGVSSRTFSYLDHYAFWRVVGWLRRKHAKANWRTLRRCHLPRRQPAGTHTTLHRPRSVRITRYRYPGQQIATPWARSETVG